MKNLLSIAVVTVFGLTAQQTAAQARQDRLLLDIQYNAAFPTGSFKSDLISKPSYLGGAVAIQYQLNPKWRAGLQVSYQNFLEKEARQVYALSPNESISAVRQRQLHTTPIMAIATFVPNADNGRAAIQPYVRAGAGLAIHSYQDYLGEYAIMEDAKTGFAARVGGGVMIPFGFRRNASINIGASYLLAPVGDWVTGNLNQVQASVGVSFPIQ